MLPDLAVIAAYFNYCISLIRSTARLFFKDGCQSRGFSQLPRLGYLFHCFFYPFVYCLNPKTISNHRKSFVDMDKTDPLDAYVIADFARCGKISSSPWRGSQFLALKRLTRHRFHLVQLMSREKVYSE